METNNFESNPSEKQHSEKKLDTDIDPNPDPTHKPEPDPKPDPADTGTSNSGPDSPKPAAEAEDLEKTTDVDQVQDDDNVEKVEEAPQGIRDTLKSVSEEIDQFLLSLSSWKGKKEIKDDDKNDDDKKDDEKEGENDEKVTSIDIPAFVENFLNLVGELVIEYETSTEGKGKWGQVPEDDLAFLDAVNQVSKLTNSLSEFKSDPNNCTLVNYSGGIYQRAMSFLEDQFRLLLEDYKGNNELEHNTDAKGKQQEDKDSCALPESDEQVTEKEEKEKEEEDDFTGYSKHVVANLNRIAKEMILGGYESECYQVYVITRRYVFDECLDKLGFEKMSIDEVQKMHWEALECEISAWIKTFKDCATIYFAKERKFCEAVFSDFPSISSSLFSNLVRGVMIQLLNFTEGISMTRPSAEKLFKFLDMYETLRDSISAINALFPQESENELKPEMTAAKCRIGETAISIFCDLENSIKSDTGKTPVPGGAVHPLTRYTMNYLKYACEYMTTLEQMFKEHSKIERADSTSRPHFEGKPQDFKSNTNGGENSSPFSAQLMRVMDLLDANLEAKAKLYKEIELSSIFMMNNGRYILQKIKGSSEIHEVVGDPWFRRKSSDLRNFHKSYQRETWGKLLSYLGHEGLLVHGKVAKPVLKERFKNFSLMFDEIHRTQSTWVVSDEQLQTELRVSISAVVIPAYRSFWGRFSHYLDPGRQYEKYIKYQPEDIEDCIEELFDGRKH
ncbi:exocyst complex component EXO70B1 [Manihot esculenta]|uniref:exocyst complex component EXO70B1 n=1 Tax=Manihot esculenta TaxID=3983 RepID=UPI000B5D5801|nr:exocyst complex component EXO70B1 [Manihot esculenta]